MRYNPATESQARTVEGLAAETREVINRPAPLEPIRWGELLRLAVQNGADRSYINCCELSHAQSVAQAMGNWAEARRLRAQLIAGLY